MTNDGVLDEFSAASQTANTVCGEATGTTPPGPAEVTAVDKVVVSAVVADEWVESVLAPAAQPATATITASGSHLSAAGAPRREPRG